MLNHNLHSRGGQYSVVRRGGGVYLRMTIRRRLGADCLVYKPEVEGHRTHSYLYLVMTEESTLARDEGIKRDFEGSKIIHVHGYVLPLPTEYVSHLSADTRRFTIVGCGNWWEVWSSKLWEDYKKRHLTPKLQITNKW